MKLRKLIFWGIILLLLLLTFEKSIPDKYLPEGMREYLHKTQEKIDDFDMEGALEKIPTKEIVELVPEEYKERVQEILPVKSEITMQDIQSISILERKELRDMINEYSKTAQGNTTIGSFDTAKRKLTEVYETKLPAITFYCGCEFERKNVDTTSCGFENNGKFNNRAKLVEIEHLVPAEHFWKAFEEWRTPEKFTQCKGKTSRACAWTNPIYKAMEADLYNLVPAIGSINAQRSNYNFGMVNSKEKVFGTCEFYLEERTAEPRDEIKGDIARVYFYMATVYPQVNLLSSQSEKLYLAWSKKDPIDKNECQRYQVLKEIQKNINPILEEPCKKWI